MSAGCNHHQNKLLGITQFPDYPSASGIAYANNRFYIAGDDATYVLVVDENLQQTDTIRISDYEGKRIPKDIKPDIEAVFLSPDKRELSMVGSGSLPPYRSVFWRVNTQTHEKFSYPLDSLYNAFRKSGINEINMEAACYFKDLMVFGNRGHKNYPKNQLVFLSLKDINSITNNPEFSVSEIVTDNDSSTFSGISDMAYLASSDQLILTASTEDTRSVHEDGAIGKSFIWIINKASLKTKGSTITPDRIIDLEAIDKSFRGHKIEGVCIQVDSSEYMDLVLTADNDNGGSTLFRLRVEKD
jgi:hypothetical protein